MILLPFTETKSEMEWFAFFLILEEVLMEKPLLQYVKHDYHLRVSQRIVHWREEIIVMRFIFRRMHLEVLFSFYTF